MAEIRKKLTDIIGTFDQYSYFDGFTDGNKLDIQSKFPTEVPLVAEKEKQEMLEMLDLEDVYLADQIRTNQNSLSTQKRPVKNFDEFICERYYTPKAVVSDFEEEDDEDMDELDFTDED